MAIQKKQTKNSETSIQSQLEKLTAEKAISEYVWNAFDANAKTVIINTIPNGLSGLTSIEIIDDGMGINFDEIDDTFGQFLDSKKRIKRTPTTRGHKGKGRFSFCKFSDKAEWTSWNSGKEFKLSIVSSHLNEYEHSDLLPNSEKKPGTKVYFNPITITEEHFNSEVVPFIQNDVSWLLITNPELNLIINGNNIQPVNYASSSTVTEFETDTFNLKTVIWSQKPVIEKSCIYYLDSNNNVVHKESSEMNRKGFDCSSYVTSDWFNNFTEESDLLSPSDNIIESEAFKFISATVKRQLREEYRKYKDNAADNLIQTYLTEGVFPEYKGENRMLSEFKRNQLIETIKVIYEAEPQIFSSLNKKQKKVLVKLIDRIIETNNLSNLFDIFEGIISLSEDEIDKLSSVIKRSSLSNITRTLSFINDRLDIIDYFKKVIYENKKISYEVNHVQKNIENNLWLFGEQYTLVSSEEEKFDKALRNYLEKVKGFNEEHYNKYSVSHPDKLKEMDIFAAQKIKRYTENNEEYFHCIVIELKKPSIKLGDEELNQIKLYKNIISNTDEFNDGNTRWDFILVGNDISQSKITAANLASDLESNKIHGEFGLVQKTNNMKIYVRTWKQILNEYDLRYNDLIDKLKLKEIEIAQEMGPDEISAEITKKTA
ncbi:ATP-binding protein [Pantoea sp. KXB25]|uniref:ATP-binding protein n=1 Tax=unclassified Pantoea TaxID=2630326 RepID=UPI003AB3B096